MEDNERWEPIPGWEGWYEASDHGRVRAMKRGKGFGFGGKSADDYPLVLQPLEYRKGYLKVYLGTCGGVRKARRLFIHRVVWMAFNGAIPKGITVNHIDGDPSNNRLANLELATYTRQVHHARRLGLAKHPTADGYIKPHLTADDVREIRKLREQNGTTYAALADQFGCSTSNIRFIVARKTWKHVS